MTKIIQIAKDFSETPFGRTRDMSTSSGQAFREDILLPALKANDEVTIVLDGAFGYGSSFLEEAFGGLVRNDGFKKDDILKKIKFVSNDDPSLIDEIHEYINI